MPETMPETIQVFYRNIAQIGVNGPANTELLYPAICRHAYAPDPGGGGHT